jgi:hypothetical protein
LRIIINTIGTEVIFCTAFYATKFQTRAAQWTNMAVRSWRLISLYSPVSCTLPSVTPSQPQLNGSSQHRMRSASWIMPSMTPGLLTAYRKIREVFWIFKLVSTTREQAVRTKVTGNLRTICEDSENTSACSRMEHVTPTGELSSVNARLSAERLLYIG